MDAFKKDLFVNVTWEFVMQCSIQVGQTILLKCFQEQTHAPREPFKPI